MKEFAVSMMDTFVPHIALKVAGSGGAEGREESGTMLSLPRAREEGGGAVRRFTRVGDSNGIEE
jgi:hypothetical protein